MYVGQGGKSRTCWEESQAIGRIGKNSRSSQSALLIKSSHRDWH